MKEQFDDGTWQEIGRAFSLDRERGEKSDSFWHGYRSV